MSVCEARSKLPALPLRESTRTPWCAVRGKRRSRVKDDDSTMTLPAMRLASQVGRDALSQSEAKARRRRMKDFRGFSRGTAAIGPNLSRFSC
jgi:hypothetical protein